jgi:hypothetical protein
MKYPSKFMSGLVLNSAVETKTTINSQKASECGAPGRKKYQT